MVICSRCIIYAEYDNCKRYMQLLIPYRYEWKENEKFPLLIFIPGSAWYRQEMYNSIPNYAKLAERGMVTAIVQYRESTLSPFPAQVYDVNNAINFLIEKADEFHIDVTKIFIMGNSSGGHIALITSFMKAHGIICGDYNMKGTIAESASTDMFLSDLENKDMPEWMPKDFRPIHDLLKVNKISDNIELAKQASCESYISKDITLPPVLLIHGNADNQVNIKHSQQLYLQLKNADKDVTFYELEGCNHGGAVFWTREIIDIVDLFVKKHCE